MAYIHENDDEQYEEMPAYLEATFIELVAAQILDDQILDAEYISDE